MKQKAKLKCYKKAGPVSENPLYKSNADYAYQAWRKSLPDNLSQESRGYNLRGAWEAGNEMSFEPDGAFHLSSRNPDTGEILKSPEHHTYDMAIEGDIKAGYGPRIDARTGKIYTINPNDPATAGPFKKKTGGLMFRLKTGGAIPDIKDTSHFPPVSASENDLTLNFGNWAKGGMLKRADGSYSRRGLWDNIRANKGSGKKPTPQMLAQEKKIRAQEKAYGGTIDNGFTDSTPAVGRWAGGGSIEYADSKFWEDRPVQMRLKAPGYADGGGVETPPEYPSLSSDTTTVMINDSRKIRATTGKKINPNVDLKTGRYRRDVIDSLARYAVNNNINPNRMIAMGLQESKLGQSDESIGHTLYGKKNQSEYQDMVDAIKEKDALAARLGKTKIEDIYQAYNGYGLLKSNTEKDYYGHNNKSFYGVPVSKGHPIDLNKNPLYGKEIMDIQENVIKPNQEIQDIVETYKPIMAKIYKPKPSTKSPFYPSGLKNGGAIKYTDGNVVRYTKEEHIPFVKENEGTALESWRPPNKYKFTQPVAEYTKNPPLQVNTQTSGLNLSGFKIPDINLPKMQLNTAKKGASYATTILPSLNEREKIVTGPGVGLHHQFAGPLGLDIGADAIPIAGAGVKNGNIGALGRASASLNPSVSFQKSNLGLYGNAQVSSNYMIPWAHDLINSKTNPNINEQVNTYGKIGAGVYYKNPFGSGYPSQAKIGPTVNYDFQTKNVRPGIQGQLVGEIIDKNARTSMFPSGHASVNFEYSPGKNPISVTGTYRHPIGAQSKKYIQPVTNWVNGGKIKYKPSLQYKKK